MCVYSPKFPYINFEHFDKFWRHRLTINNFSSTLSKTTKAAYPQTNISVSFATRQEALFVEGIPSQRWFFVSWQQDNQNFSLRVDPPLQFCRKLLSIYYKLWVIIWLNKSKILRCQQDDEDLSLRVYPLPGLNLISENISLNPWIKSSTARRLNLI